MASLSENSYAKNVANFKELISVVLNYGDRYNPSKPLIKVAELQRLHGDAVDAMQRVSDAKTVYARAINDRDLLFRDLKPRSSRVLNALAATDTLRETVDDARAIKMKIDGRRITSVSAATPSSTGQEVKRVRRSSVSQQSYDMQIENFNNLLTLVSKDPLYVPNEEDLKVESLSNFIANLRERNEAANNAALLLSTARTTRDRLLHNEGTGLKDVANAVKAYVKSVFGNGTKESKEAMAISVK